MISGNAAHQIVRVYQTENELIDNRTQRATIAGNISGTEYLRKFSGRSSIVALCSRRMMIGSSLRTEWIIMAISAFSSGESP